MSIIPQLRAISEKLYIIVDNTWLTHVIYNPLNNNADIVVISLTKYYSGGHAIAGAVLTNHTDIYDIMIEHNRCMGYHVSPHNCEIVFQNIVTLNERIINSSKLTMKVAQYLKNHKKIVKM